MKNAPSATSTDLLVTELKTLLKTALQSTSLIAFENQVRHLKKILEKNSPHIPKIIVRHKLLIEAYFKPYTTQNYIGVQHYIAYQLWQTLFACLPLEKQLLELKNQNISTSTVFQSAIIGNNRLLVKTILKSCFDLLSPEDQHKNLTNVNKIGFTPLNSALNSRNYEIVALLLEYLDKDNKALSINLTNRVKNGFMPLQSALMNCDFKTVNLLMKYLAKDKDALSKNLSNCNNDGFMPLQSALMTSNYEIVKLIMEYLDKDNDALSKNLSSCTIGGFMPLQTALNTRNYEIVKLIMEYLDKDKDVLTKNLTNCTKDGFMSLQSALILGSYETVNLLIKYLDKDNDALTKNLTNCTKDGFMPLQSALSSDNDEITKLLMEYLSKDKDSLIKNLSSCIKGGFMILHMVLKSGNYQKVKYVIEELAKHPSILILNLKKISTNGFSPLKQAFLTQNGDIIKLLLKELIKFRETCIKQIEHMDHLGFTLFDNAWRHETPEIFKLYLMLVSYLYKDNAKAALKRLYSQSKQTYHSKKIKDLLHKALAGEFPELDEVFKFTSITPFAGINPKYLDLNPIHKSHYVVSEDKAKSYEGSHECKKLSYYRGSIKLKSFPIDSAYFTATFYTSADNIKCKDKVTFVCAGRKENALVPKPDIGRCVWVCTEEEFKDLNAKQLCFSNTDVLVIKKMVTVFGESNHLGLLTNRRLGIFLAANHWQLDHFMMLDDNIKQVQFNPTADAKKYTNSWDRLYITLLGSLGNEPCVTLTRHYEKLTEPGQLGSKLFMIDMKSIRKKFPTESAITMLFPQPAQAGFWGEDYYFQLVLHFAFREKNQGYRVLDKDIAVLIRAAKHANAFAQSNGKRIFAQHFPQPATIIDHHEQYQWIQQAIEHINSIINDNKEKYQKKKASQQLKAPPLKRQKTLHNITSSQSQRNSNHSTGHLFAQFSSGAREPIVISSPPKVPDHFHETFLKSIRNLSADHLRDYQHDAMMAIKIDHAQKMGSIIMAASTGKTRVQSALACLGYQHLKPGEHIVIVTKDTALVSQFDENLRNNRLPYNDELINNNIPDEAIIAVSYQHTPLDRLLAESNFEKPKVFIFCIDSFINLIESHASLMAFFKLLMLDEYHSYELQATHLIGLRKAFNDHLTLGFTATPPRVNPLPMIYHYSLVQAVRESVVAPIIADCLPLSPEQSVDDFLPKIPNIIKNRWHPSFSDKATLADMKGMIFLKTTDQCNALQKYCADNNIPSFAIHSDNPRCKEELEAFKKSDKGIILTCKMCTIGFDDKDIGYVILTTKPERKSLEQMICRATRRNGDKIAYVISLYQSVHDEIMDLVKGQKLNLPVSCDYLALECVEKEQDKEENEIKKSDIINFDSELPEQPASTIERLSQLLNTASKICLTTTPLLSAPQNITSLVEADFHDSEFLGFLGALDFFNQEVQKSTPKNISGTVINKRRINDEEPYPSLNGQIEQPKIKAKINLHQKSTKIEFDSIPGFVQRKRKVLPGRVESGKKIDNQSGFSIHKKNCVSQKQINVGLNQNGDSQNCINDQRVPKSKRHKTNW